jgi:hypothetical protein
MFARHFAGIIGLTLLLTVAVSRAEHTGRIEPLDGSHGVVASPGRSEMRQQRGPLVPEVPEALSTAIPYGQAPARSATPFGSPSPPNQLTPAPVLPFHPNRPLMPPSSAPVPYPGGGRLGR